MLAGFCGGYTLRIQSWLLHYVGGEGKKWEEEVPSRVFSTRDRQPLCCLPPPLAEQKKSGVAAAASILTISPLAPTSRWESAGAVRARASPGWSPREIGHLAGSWWSPELTPLPSALGWALWGFCPRLWGAKVEPVLFVCKDVNRCHPLCLRIMIHEMSQGKIHGSGSTVALLEGLFWWDVPRESRTSVGAPT